MDFHFRNDKGDAVFVERGQLEQHVATRHRAADRLAEVAGNNDAVERRAQLGALQHLLGKLDLGIFLFDLRPGNAARREIAAAQSAVELKLVLTPLGDVAQPVKRQVVVLQLGEQAAFADDLAGARVLRADIAVERGVDDAPDLALNLRVGVDAERVGRKDQEQHADERDGAADLIAEMAGAVEPAGELRRAMGRDPMQAPVALLLVDQDGSARGAQRVAQVELVLG